jgi:ribosomal protein L28
MGPMMRTKITPTIILIGTRAIKINHNSQWQRTREQSAIEHHTRREFIINQVWRKSHLITGSFFPLYASAGAIKRPKPTEPIAPLINELPREASNQICPRDE